MQFKQLWDLESAMKVLENDSVDSKLWAEAVEWLMMFGPPKIQKLLLEASKTAMNSSFPELKPTHYTDDGEPCYDVGELAQSLGITKEEVQEILKKKAIEHENVELFQDDDTSTVH